MMTRLPSRKLIWFLTRRAGWLWFQIGRQNPLGSILAAPLLAVAALMMLIMMLALVVVFLVLLLAWRIFAPLRGSSPDEFGGRLRHDEW